MPRSFGPSGPISGTAVELAPSAARTTSGNGTSLPTEDIQTLRLTLSVTAASGTTPSLTVTIQTSDDGSTWATVASFAAKTTTGSERKVFSGIDRFVRASWAITGTTPSLTFAVTGEAV